MANEVRDLSRAALIVVDMQNDFLHRDGVFGRMAREKPIDIEFLGSSVPAARRLVEAFRAAGRPVIYIAHVIKPDYSDAAFPHWREGALREEGFITEGSWGAAIVDELAPEAGERVVVKKGFGGFDHTELDLVLRNLGIDTCVVCGVTTCVCVSTTVRGAIARNYRAVIARDAVAEVNRQTHEAELQTMARVFCEVKSADEILAMLRDAAPTRLAS
jgi:ureidoacrylate peracid hydrolase